jgi:hypothetical protein
MEEIKVGDYIRTEQWGIAKVAKVDKNGECTYIKNKNDRLTHYFTQIGNTSPNIIDLIEVGDYVNGCEVVDVLKNARSVHIDDFLDPQLFEKDFKSIVTKEQFNSIKYNIGE